MRWLVSISLLVLAGCQDQVDWNRMMETPRFDTYEPNPFFPDGKTLQRPPEGTVHRGALLGSPALLEGRDARGAVTRMPVPVTMELLRRGRSRYDIFCAACHGVAGDADTQVAENMRLRPPPSLLSARNRALSPGHLYRVIREGYGLMPAYNDDLDVLDRWAVVAYVRALQLSQRARLAALPEPLRQRARFELPPEGSEEARTWQ